MLISQKLLKRKVRTNPFQTQSAGEVSGLPDTEIQELLKDLDWSLRKYLDSASSDSQEEETSNLASFTSHFLALLEVVESKKNLAEADVSSLNQQAQTLVDEFHFVASTITDEQEKEDILGLCEDLLSSLSQFFSLAEGNTKTMPLLTFFRSWLWRS